MAKRFVRIPLAAKCRLLFGAATILIVGAALVVPWRYMEAMAEQRVLRAGEEVTRLYFGEWLAKHPQSDRAARIGEVADLFVSDDPTGLRKGPVFIELDAAGVAERADAPHLRQARNTFLRLRGRTMLQIVASDEGRRVYHVYRAVRAARSCLSSACHDVSADSARQWKLNELKGMIAADLPETSAGGGLVLSRLVILAAGVAAIVLATLTFYLIIRRLVLSPVRKLRLMAGRAADGYLTVRSPLRTGDEFEQLGSSFDEMLEAVATSQQQLRQANRALDVKLNELAEANVALFESNRLKSDFLGNVSHELRTPLNSIIGFAELLAEDGDERVRYAGNILTPARMLLRIINDLLDLARIEAGKLPLTVTRASVADICETLVSLVTPEAQKHDLTVRLESCENVPVIETDAGKVQQILYNLLSNAVKFTPAGGSVTVTAEAAKAAEAAEARRTAHAAGDEGGVLVHVADTGPGISEADQANIFEKFYQADSTVTRQHGGAGLGLGIARELTGILGGRLSFVSEPGRGTTFSLWLPARMSEPPTNGRREPASDDSAK